MSLSDLSLFIHISVLIQSLFAFKIVNSLIHLNPESNTFNAAYVVLPDTEYEETCCVSGSILCRKRKIRKGKGKEEKRKEKRKEKTEKAKKREKK